MTNYEKKFGNPIVLIVLLSLNILLLLYVAFFKRDSLWFETMRIGGPENMALVQEFFNSDIYKTQQTQAIKQALSTIKNQQNDQLLQMQAQSASGLVESLGQ